MSSFIRGSKSKMAEKLEAIAHVKKNEDGTWAQPQSLEDHLQGTAERAERFASAFGSGSWGKAEGIGHDTGKARDEWQCYIRTKSGYDEEAGLETKRGKVDHSTPSAKLAEEVFGKGPGRILAYCIAGHHAGLPDFLETPGCLAVRLQKTKTCDIPETYHTKIKASAPGGAPRKFDSHGLDMSLWIRMLFSCLVDADFLDTEAYMQTDKAELRGHYLPIGELLVPFNAYMEQKTKAALAGSVSVVTIARQTVLADCRAAAALSPGFFSLTVPTGGGKTLSSMAFALEHAACYKKERVIYVIPYTSIIEQNAKVFREALGPDQVVEHHSNLDDDDSTPQARLAAENWDAPVIVTTSVQFFESLFAAKTSRCRKLHNIVNSVVILDEAQLLPAEFLEPIIEAMRLLSVHYGTSFVICTATQPVLERQDDFPQFPGLPQGSMREIIADVPSLYQDLKRVKVFTPEDLRTPKSWDEIAQELLAEERVLCVVSDRKSCRELHALMPKGTYHLSALMCAQHRSDRIAEIKEKLKNGDPVRVVSTQLVEAGVDIDFPVVYRAMAGLDSIAQAAGRCNREGKLNTEGRLGKVIVFIPPRKAPAGILRKASETAARMIEARLSDPIDHEVFAPYFSELYWKTNSLDGKGIMKLLEPDSLDCGIQFRSAAEAFQIIDEGTQSTILVPYKEDGKKLIEELKAMGPERWLLRKLQRYSVNIYHDQFNNLLNRGSLEEVSPGLFALSCEIEYDNNIGLLVDEMPTDPASFIAI
jgi:CRISPR-associated endonuclease/helicase Cas3